jgi:hypothetical protein
MTDTNLDSIRQQALDRIDRAERHYRMAFFGGAGLEVLFLAAFLLIADLSDRLHVLLLLSAVATYTIVILGLVALGASNRRDTLIVIKGLEALRRQ